MNRRYVFPDRKPHRIIFTSKPPQPGLIRSVLLASAIGIGLAACAVNWWFTYFTI